MRFSARIISIFLVVLFLTTYLLQPISAYAQTVNPYNQLMKTDSSVNMNIAVLTQGIVVGLLSTATCLVGGIDFSTPNHQCLSYNSTTQTYSYVPNNNNTGGLLGFAANATTLVFTPPFHTSDYLSYLSQNFGIVKSAHAANGIGFSQLAPITSLWLAFRNMAYLLFVAIFVVVGFAVMVRAKMDPRTVMTIENQIPKLIVALILITFSFAIAGLMIDIMWVGIYLVINLFGQLDLTLHGQISAITGAVKNDPFNWVSTLNGNGPSGNAPLGFLGIAQQAAGGVKDLVNNIADNVFQQVGFLKVFLVSLIGLPVIISCVFSTLTTGAGNALSTASNLFPPIALFHLGQTIVQHITGTADTQTTNQLNNFGSCLDAGAATIVSTIIGAVAFLIFAIALLIAIARLWWALIKAYALFIIFTIFGPIVIMSGVIPGWTKTNFEYWLRHILAYTIVFPTAMGIFLLAKTLMDIYVSNNSTSATLMPPLFGANLGVNGNALAFMGPLIGFALMMMAPQALAMVQDALNAPDPKYLAGIGSIIAGGTQSYTSLGMQQVRRAFRAPDYVAQVQEGWGRRAMPGWLKGFVYGRPMDRKEPLEPGGGFGNTKVPSE